jgi:hypothetical protein
VVDVEDLEGLLEDLYLLWGQLLLLSLVFFMIGQWLAVRDCLLALQLVLGRRAQEF